MDNYDSLEPTDLISAQDFNEILERHPSVAQTVTDFCSELESGSNVPVQNSFRLHSDVQQNYVKQECEHLRSVVKDDRLDSTPPELMLPINFSEVNSSHLAVIQQSSSTSADGVRLIASSIHPLHPSRAAIPHTDSVNDEGGSNHLPPISSFTPFADVSYPPFRSNTSYQFNNTQHCTGKYFHQSDSVMLHPEFNEVVSMLNSSISHPQSSNSNFISNSDGLNGSKIVPGQNLVLYSLNGGQASNHTVGPFKQATLSSQTARQTVVSSNLKPVNKNQSLSYVTANAFDHSGVNHINPEFVPCYTDADSQTLDAINLKNSNITNNEDIKFTTSFVPPRDLPIDISSIKNWLGNFDFRISLQKKDAKHNWCFSEKLGRLYIKPLEAADVQVSVNDWDSLSGKSVQIFVCPVYVSSGYRGHPVNCCHNCRAKLPVNSSSIVQVLNNNAVYAQVDGRNVVYVPLSRPHPGESYANLLVSCSCMNSCVGGPNRRQFAFLFSLLVDGKEAGRQVLDIKCCRAPFRDVQNEMKKAGEGEVSCTREAVVVGVKRTRKMHGHNLTDSSSDSDGDRSSEGKKVKRAVQYLLADVNGHRESRCSLSVVSAGRPNAVDITFRNVPEEWRRDVIESVKAVLAKKYLEAHSPDFFCEF